MLLRIAAVLALVAAVCLADVDHGWGKSIEWRGFQAGLAEAKTSGKPLMLIIHKSWCGACKALKPKFAESQKIAELSKNFVMVNVEDDEEPDGAQYSPDGGYIPRVLFLSPEGTVQDDLYNKEGSPKYKYYYSSPEAVANGMEAASKHFGKARTQ